MHRNSLRERYDKKRKERQDILGTGSLLEPLEDKKSVVLTEGLFISNRFQMFFNIIKFISISLKTLTRKNV